ncbi:MAG TPA: PAS domain S-box protein, partial [Deltaproteobacteria bacterium]|nr:PAS domain S-box protein [Deltaproteobacteria bacterium]
MEHRILIVEDDLVFRNYLYQVLKYDYDVTAVPGPLEAIRAIKEKPFSLMITDLRMPDMDGRALVEKVHGELDANMMVIVVTAFEDDWPVDHAMSSNVFRYLRKGAFLPSELKQNVEKALEVRESMVSLNEYRRRADISETLYKDVFDNSNDALFVTDTDMRPLAANRRFEEMCGYDLTELQGKTLFDLIAEQGREHARSALAAQAAGEGPGSVRVTLVPKTGPQRQVKVWARLVTDETGSANAVFCLARDADQGREAGTQDSVAGLKEELEEKSRLVGELQEKLRKLTWQAKDMIVWLDAGCTCEYINAEAERLLGYAPGSMQGRKIPWEEIVHAEDRLVLERIRGLVRDKAQRDEGEIRVLSASGQVVHLSYRVFLEHDDGGGCAISVVAEDVSQRKAFEQELKNANSKLQEFNERLAGGVSRKIRALMESEERYKNIVEDSGDIIFSLDGEARIVYMNRKGLQTLGMSMDQVYHKHCSEFITDESSEKRLDRIISAMDTSDYHGPFDLAIDTPSGRKIYRADLAKIGDKSRPETVCVARDISEDIAKKKRLHLLANIEYYSADAIIGFDAAGKILSWNQGAREMFGWSEEEVVGRDVFILVPEEGLSEAEDMLIEVGSKGLIKEHEARWRTRDGQILDVSVTMTQLRDEAGDVFGFSAIIMDLTEKKKMETALIQTERLAAMGKLSASIVHEINNPLYGIRSCLNHVLAAAPGGVDRKFVQLAVKETDRIAELIRNMKTFYQQGDGTVQETDVAELLREVFILNRKYLEENMV